MSFVAYGVGITAERTEELVEGGADWGPTFRGNAGQFGKDHDNWSEFDSNNANGSITEDRSHVRWNQSEPHGLGHDNYLYVAGTPHFEEFVKEEGGCEMLGGLTGNHAVRSFNRGRGDLKQALPSAYPRFYRQTGSTTKVRQCDNTEVGGDGNVLWMRLAARSLASASASSPASRAQDSPAVVDNAEPAAVTAPVGRACPQDGSADFDNYYVGDQFEGLRLTSRRRSCEAPPAVVRSATGDLVHERPVRVNDVSYVYGDCWQPPVGAGARVPPLQIVSSPGCERPHSLYHRYVGPPGLGLEAEPHRDMQLRGVKIAVFDEGERLEIYTRNSTVAISASDPRLAAMAARRMIAAPTSHGGQRAPEAALPAARSGVSAEMLPAQARGSDPAPAAAC